MESPPRSGRFTSQHTLFAALIDTGLGLQLQAPPFDAVADELTHPSRYDATQALGSQMREAGIAAFEYRSARVRHGDALNTALFVPAALASRMPDAQQPWLCETRAETVVFSGQGRALRFVLADFLVDGLLPQPA